MIIYLTGLKAEREPVMPCTYRRTSLTASKAPEREGGNMGAWCWTLASKNQSKLRARSHPLSLHFHIG